MHATGQRLSAVDAYKKGMEVDPNNEQLRKEMVNLQSEISSSSGFGGKVDTNVKEWQMGWPFDGDMFDVKRLK